MTRTLHETSQPGIEWALGARMHPGQLSRRAFLASCGAAFAPAAISLRQRSRPGRPVELEAPLERRVASVRERLRAKYRDLHRHFIFEYYPWYGADPWRHWDEGGRIPPSTLSASSLPLLGGYDSRSVRVIEQHAKWIAEAGVGAINMSWWGRGSYEDAAAHTVMDVMRAFDIRVTFYLEPYSRERGIRFADDILYILREYGERRRWDTLLLLEDADGSAAPIFKTFSTLLAPTTTDCLGVTRPVDIYVPDDVWRQQIDWVRREIQVDFDRITFVSDSLDPARTASAGFDAGAVGDPYIPPDDWAAFTARFDSAAIPFAFAVNAGFDAIVPTPAPADPCYRPRAFDPPASVRWNLGVSRARAHQLAARRIFESFERTLMHQTDPQSANWRRGLLLVPINSFNEWHEGTAFEPMKSFRELTEAERLQYHNPLDGSYRLKLLRNLMELLV